MGLTPFSVALFLSPPGGRKRVERREALGTRSSWVFFLYN